MGPGRPELRGKEREHSVEIPLDVLRFFQSPGFYSIPHLRKRKKVEVSGVSPLDGVSPSPRITFWSMLGLIHGP